MRHILSIFSLFTFVPMALGQLVAFTGIDANFPDEFAFVALQDLPNGTEIIFTEGAYDNTTGDFLNDSTVGTLLFTVAGTLSTGTVVQITETAGNVFTVTGNGGTAVIVGANNWIVSGAVPHYAFSTSNTSSPWTNVTEVHAMMFVSNAALGNLDPIPDYANAIVASGFTGPENAADYTGSRMAATHMTLADQSNFTAGAGDITFDLTMFTIALGPLVAFTGIDANFPDEFAFVALQDLSAGTEIIFTEGAYDNTTGEFANDSSVGTLHFTVTGTLSTGTVVQITETAGNTFTVTGNGGTAVIVGANNWIVSGAVPHYAFSTSNTSSPWTNVTEVHAMMFVSNVALGNLDPIPDYANAIVASGFTGPENAADYTGSRMAATHMTLADQSNFTAGAGDITFDLTMFTSVPVELFSFSVE